MVKSVTNRGDSSYQMASSHLITTFATLAALILFVLVGAKVLPSAIGLTKAGQPAMVVAFLLNIAIILFGWRRANDLNQTLSALKAAEQEALDNAYTDHTTGLGNRRSILRELERAFRDGKAKGALVILDLDHFKKVNDLYGHAAGDQLLQFTGETISEELPTSSFAARLGGDEFAAYIADPEIAEEVTRRIVAKLAAPISLGPVKTQLSASAGLAHLNRNLNPEEILRRADVAMYSVKRSGRNGIAWFDEEMSRQLQSRVALEEEIRAALEADEFVPFFQPLISLETGEQHTRDTHAVAAATERIIGVPASQTAEILGASGGVSTIADPAALLALYVEATERIWRHVDGWRT